MQLEKTRKSEEKNEQNEVKTRKNWTPQKGDKNGKGRS